MKVAISCARWLGVQCLRELVEQASTRGIEISGVHVPDEGWWDDVDDAQEVNHLGLRRQEPAEFQADLVFSVLSSHIFKTSEIPQLGAINLHCAPLPEYRGCNGVAHAIMNGDSAFAATLHYMDAGIDTGPVIARQWVHVEELETGLNLYRKTQVAALTLWQRQLPLILDAALAGARVSSFVQDESRAGYYRRDSLKDKSVSGLPFPEAHRKRRALHHPPFPPAEGD